MLSAKRNRDLILVTLISNMFTSRKKRYLDTRVRHKFLGSAYHHTLLCVLWVTFATAPAIQVNGIAAEFQRKLTSVVILEISVRSTLQWAPIQEAQHVTNRDKVLAAQCRVLATIKIRRMNIALYIANAYNLHRAYVCVHAAELTPKPLMLWALLP